MPFSKRSEYFALFEQVANIRINQYWKSLASTTEDPFFQLLLDMDGSSKEEASRRLGANIIVDPSWVSSPSPSSSSSEGGSTSSFGEEGCRRFSDLQEGLSAAKEGDVVYLEQGFYFREEVDHMNTKTFESWIYCPKLLSIMTKLQKPGFHCPLFRHPDWEQHQRCPVGQQGGAYIAGANTRSFENYVFLKLKQRFAVRSSENYVF